MNERAPERRRAQRLLELAADEAFWDLKLDYIKQFQAFIPDIDVPKRFKDNLPQNLKSMIMFSECSEYGEISSKKFK